jgi:hypothetical protein
MRDRDAVSTALDLLGLLLIAAGVTAGMVSLIGWSALAVGGGVVLAGAWWGDRQHEIRKQGGSR